MATYTTNLSLKKPDQSDKIRIADFNGNSDAIDAAIGAGFGVGSNPSINNAVNSLAGGLAIISNGDTHAAVLTGQYVYVRGHATLTEGLYVAIAAIAQNGALSASNVTAVSGGGLNSLRSIQGVTQTTTTTIASMVQSTNVGQIRTWSETSASSITDYPTSLDSYKAYPIFRVNRLDSARSIVEVIGVAQSGTPKYAYAYCLSGTFYWNV